MQTTPEGNVRLFIRSVQGGAIKSLFEVLRDIVHDVNIIFDETGGKLVTMDSARCSLIYLKLRAESFEEYKCNGKVRLGLNMASMHKLLKTMSSHDSVIMYNTEEAANELGIHITNSEKKATTNFTLKLLDVDGDEINIPEVEFDTVVALPSIYFQRLTRDISNLSDAITITSTPTSLILKCNGDFASQETEIQSSSGTAPSAEAPLTSISTHENQTISGTYALKYITLFCKASSLCATVELFIRRDYPLVIKYDVASLGELRFCLAPKVEDDA